MFQKCSFSVPSDLSGALLVKVIQTRSCNSSRHAGITKFLSVVMRNCSLILNKKAKRKMWVKQKSSALVISSQSFFKKGGDLVYNYNCNSLVLLKSRMNVRGGEVYGPVCSNLKISKFSYNFNFIF